MKKLEINIAILVIALFTILQLTGVAEYIYSWMRVSSEIISTSNNNYIIHLKFGFELLIKIVLVFFLFKRSKWAWLIALLMTTYSTIYIPKYYFNDYFFKPIITLLTISGLIICYPKKYYRLSNRFYWVGLIFVFVLISSIVILAYDFINNFDFRL